jgi:Na+-driven multidrug efflux pump
LDPVELSDVGRPGAPARLEEPGAPARPGGLAHLGDERQTGRMVMRIAWPAIVENALHTLLGIVDTILVARLGTEAVAGVGAGGGLAVGRTLTASGRRPGAAWIG